MQTNILWTGREYYSLENCRVDITATGTIVESTIIGYYQEIIYKVIYTIRTNSNWETVFLRIDSRQNEHQQSIQLVSDGRGNWTLNGTKAEQFHGCRDVDIPLTPFTNTLPIRRLRMKAGESKLIDVVYCDLLEKNFHPVRQRYTCISPHAYHYENVPNDFEATLVVDDLGLVEDYPELFVRTTAIHLT